MMTGTLNLILQPYQNIQFFTIETVGAGTGH